jgi:hypothetical protein
MSVAYEQKASSALQQLGLEVAEKQLDQAAQQAAASGWSYTHFLGYLLDAEMRFRHEKTVRLNLQFANLPYQKHLTDFQFKEQRSSEWSLEGSALVLACNQGIRGSILSAPKGVSSKCVLINWPYTDGFIPVPWNSEDCRSKTKVTILPFQGVSRRK